MLYMALFLLNPSYADDPVVGNREVVYKAKTEIDFEGIEIDGMLVKPEGSLVLERKSASFNPLIRLRTDFDKEMHDSVNEIK